MGGGPSKARNQTGEVCANACPDKETVSEFVPGKEYRDCDCVKEKQSDETFKYYQLRPDVITSATTISEDEWQEIDYPTTGGGVIAMYVIFGAVGLLVFYGFISYITRTWAQKELGISKKFPKGSSEDKAQKMLEVRDAVGLLAGLMGAGALETKVIPFKENPEVYYTVLSRAGPYKRPELQVPPSLRAGVDLKNPENQKILQLAMLYGIPPEQWAAVIAQKKTPEEAEAIFRAPRMGELVDPEEALAREAEKRRERVFERRKKRRERDIALAQQSEQIAATRKAIEEIKQQQSDDEKDALIRNLQTELKYAKMYGPRRVRSRSRSPSPSPSPERSGSADRQLVPSSRKKIKRKSK